MRLVGVVLLVLGLVVLIYGGIGYNRQRTVLEVGGFKATATEHKTFPITPLVGAIALAGGVVLLVVRKRTV